MLSEKEQQLLPFFQKLAKEVENDEVLKISSEAFCIGFLLGQKAGSQTSLQGFEESCNADD